VTDWVGVLAVLVPMVAVLAFGFRGEFWPLRTVAHVNNNGLHVLRVRRLLCSETWTRERGEWLRSDGVKPDIFLQLRLDDRWKAAERSERVNEARFT
jgi:hypothetical protein